MEVNYLFGAKKYESLYTEHNGSSYVLDTKYMKKYTVCPKDMVLKNYL
jgi:hypothetical protein